MKPLPPAPSLLSPLSRDPACPPFSVSSLPRSFFSGRARKSVHRTCLDGFGTLGKIPKDLPSFLRTGTLPRHNGKILQEATAKLSCSAYADTPELSSRLQSANLRNMFSTTSDAAQERPTRRLRKENRFYNFLTRSRSRSQSQPDLSTSENPESIPRVPQNGVVKEVAGSKPPHRIPSRPISSTTTATNTTITPNTPKVKKHPPSSIPVLSTRRSENPEDAQRSRSSTPSHPSNTRRTINIFGFSIRPSKDSSKSRSRSTSRPTTPRISVDIPPLPTSGPEDDFRGPQRSQSSSRAATPMSGGARADASTTLSLSSLAGHDPSAQAKDTNGDSYANPSKIRSFFASRDSSRSRHPGSASVPVDLVSAPVKRGSSLKRRSLNKSLPDRPRSPPATPLTDPLPSSPNSNPKSSIPRIVNTPATPVRSATISGGTTKSVAPPQGRTFRNMSLDTGYRYRGTMDVVDEEGRFSRESKDLKGSAIPRPTIPKGKEKESENPAPRTSVSRMSTGVRNTKHGSFDFERPGWSAIGMQRTASGGSSTTVTSGWSRSGENSTVRDSSFGPGLAGVGTVQRDVSMKRGKEREEKAREIKKRAKEAAMKKAVVVEDTELTSTKTSPSPAHSSNGHQTPPSATTSGKSSSLSKASGRRFLKNGASLNRNNTQHGLFSFEPPVPSPTWSTTSIGAGKETSASWSGRTEKEKERPRKEKERPVERKPSQKPDRSPVPVPLLPHIGGHRSGTKGRSLDLNIGLAWAPSKVRESAFLKSSSLFNRSISNSSSVFSGSGSRSANSSSHGHDTSGPRWDYTTPEERSLGRETAELFRKALGEARYMRFKTYIYQFDAHEIPFDGPIGIISKIDGLLATVPTLGLDEKRRLMDKLVRIILQNA